MDIMYQINYMIYSNQNQEDKINRRYFMYTKILENILELIKERV